MPGMSDVLRWGADSRLARAIGLVSDMGAEGDGTQTGLVRVPFGFDSSPLPPARRRPRHMSMLPCDDWIR